MKKYEFSIIASGLDPEAEDFEKRFYDAGCDDATISFQKGPHHRGLCARG